MRDKKFRIWDIETKQFFYWTISETPPTCLTKSYIESNTQQYIGLKDKNKVEIYEGDIIKTRTGVIFELKLDHLGLLYGDSPIAGRIAINLSAFKQLEIIGNIHENPKLLKERQ